MARMLRDARVPSARRQSYARISGVLFSPILVAAFIRDLSFAVWLTVKDVSMARWREKAERSTV